MRFEDACSILNLKPDYAPDELKTAYREACRKYHPDLNPAGVEMMKAVNHAYETLEKYTGQRPGPRYNKKTGEEENQYDYDYPEKLYAAIKFAFTLKNVECEICGNWLWLHGETYVARGELKAHGFMWAPAKKLWYFRPEEWKASTHGKTKSMDDIRSTYGSAWKTDKPAEDQKKIS